MAWMITSYVSGSIPKISILTPFEFLGVTLSSKESVIFHFSLLGFALGIIP